MILPAGVQLLLCPGTVMPVSKGTETNEYFEVFEDDGFLFDSKDSLSALTIVNRLPK